MPENIENKIFLHNSFDDKIKVTITSLKDLTSSTAQFRDEIAVPL